MIILKLDLTKIDKSKVFEGKKGKYIDLVLYDNKGGRDERGNDGFIAHSTTKQEREAGQRGEIVGNWKHSGSGVRKPAERNQELGATVLRELKEDDIPY